MGDTLNALRDELAGLMGWLPPMSDLPTGPGTSWPQDSGEHCVKIDEWVKLRGRRIEIQQRSHPIPDTLDAIAGAMPDGYEITIIIQPPNTGHANAICRALSFQGSDRHETEGGTEPEARLKLAIAARKAVKG